MNKSFYFILPVTWLLLCWIGGYNFDERSPLSFWVGMGAACAIGFVYNSRKWH